jgi:hypothetical protein
MDSIQSQVLTGYIFDHTIAPYLDIKDLYNLSLVNQQLYHKINEKYIQTHIKYRITNSLKKIFGDDYNLFTSAMNKAKAVISGSFLIQTILNEKWENSDIDIYVGYDENDKYSNILNEFLSSKTTDYVDGRYSKLGDIKSTTNYYFKNRIFQLVQVYTTLKCYSCMNGLKCTKKVKCEGKKQTLWDHVNNTGFDACKNMVYFNDDLNIQVKLKEYKQVINKCSVFTILDTEDFYYRLGKYSRRGFFFKPKYNKLICLEYLLRYHLRSPGGSQPIRKTNSLKHECLNNNCPLKVLFRNINHCHKMEESPGPDRYRTFIYIHTNNNMLDKLFYPSIPAVAKSILECTNLDEYAAIRNKLVTEYCLPQKIINVHNTKYLKYDIQYGLPCEPYKSTISPEKFVEKMEKIEKAKKFKQLNDDWTVVEHKKHPDKYNNKKPKNKPSIQPVQLPTKQIWVQPSAPNNTISWADHLKNIPDKKN